MTPSPRSGSSSGQDRNQPQGGRPRSGAPKSGVPKSSAPRSGGPRTGAPRTGAPRTGAPRTGAGKSNAPWSNSSKPGESREDGPKTGGFRSGGFKSGGPKSPAKSGGAKAGGFKSGGPKTRAFGGERFGRNLGPVKNRPTEQNRKNSRTSSDIDMHNPEGIRLQKIMATAGVASRRVCEEMILEGRVEVDGVLVTELGLRVDPETASVTVDGMRLQLNDSLVYMVFNKPKGVVSTMDDPDGRPCISDFLKKRNTNERLFHVGRLDVSTEGLLLLTNDGELSNRLSHPKYEVPKTYLVQVRGPMAQGVGAELKDGVELEDGWARLDSFKLVDSTPGHILVEVVLHSGKNRIVRRMFDAVGYPVERLVRVQFGPISVGDQRQGSIRVLGRQEVGHLLASVGM